MKNPRWASQPSEDKSLFNYPITKNVFIFLLFVFVFADGYASYLTTDGFGKFIDELDDARSLVCSCDALHMFFQLMRETALLASTTVAFTACPRCGSGTAVTAHSSTAGWVIRALSTSNGPMR